MKLDEIPLDDAPAEAQEGKTEQPQESRGFSLPSWIKAKTGDGSVDDYLNHPLNFGESKPFAQVLRGLTGILGSLNFAVVDILGGLVQYVKKKSNPHV